MVLEKELSKLDKEKLKRLRTRSLEKGETFRDEVVRLLAILAKSISVPSVSEEAILMRIPRAKNGKDGRNGIDGKNGKDGSDGDDGRDGIDGKNGRDGLDGKDGLLGSEGKSGKDGKDGSPDTPKDIVKKLSSLKGEERLAVEAIRGLTEELQTIRLSRASKGGGGIGDVVTFSFSGDGSTTTFALADKVAGNSLAIWAYYQGQWLQPNVHFTVSGTIITTTFTASNGTTIEGFFLRG